MKLITEEEENRACKGHRGVLDLVTEHQAVDKTTDCHRYKVGQEEWNPEVKLQEVA